MTDLKFKSAAHQHEAFLTRASRKEFEAALGDYLSTCASLGKVLVRRFCR